MTPLIVSCLLLVPVTALSCSIAARAMRRRSFGQTIRTLGPEHHAAKAGTPTMGGVVLLVLWIAGAAVLFPWHPPTTATLSVLVAGVAFAAIGAADDLISISRRRSLGLSVFAKLALSTVIAVVLFFAFEDVFSNPVRIPFGSGLVFLPPAAAFALTYTVFLATTHAVNLTDGLDGLAGGVAILVLLGTLALSDSTFTAVTAPLIAVLVGFLWINVHPADLFLGDAGSFLLGGVIAALCLAGGLAFYLPILAGLLVLEAGSVILQVLSFRIFGRRLFRMSPLHHHFELTTGPTHQHILPAFSWPEGKLTVRFWIVEAVFVGLALMADRL